MKHIYFSLFFLLIGFSQKGISQYYTPSQIATIHSSKAANEGDFYLDTINKNYFVGLTTGRLAKIGDTLDEIIDTVVYSGNKIFLIEGSDTSTLVMDSVVAEEWKDNGNYIYAKRAKQSGKDFVFTDNGSFGVGTTSPSGFEGGTGKNTIHFTGNGGTEINLESKGASSGYHPTLSYTYNGTRVGYIKMKKSTTRAIDGDMAFATHSGTSLTEKMRITKMGDVGIGTSTPFGRLQVSGGDSYFDGGPGAVSLRSDGGSNHTYIQFFAKDSNLNARSSWIGYPNSSSDVLGIQNELGNRHISLNPYGTGNIGIGTTNPEVKLHLSGEKDIEVYIEADTDNIDEDDNPTLHFIQDNKLVTGKMGLNNNTPDDKYLESISNSMYLETSVDMQLVTGGNASGTSKGTSRLTIKNNGNIGVGTKNPSTIFQIGDQTKNNIRVYANIAADNNAYIEFRGQNDATRNGYIGYGTTGFYINSETGPLKINTSGGENVGIATNVPSYRLHVNGSVAGVGAYTSLSDKRFKKEIASLAGGLDIVKKLHPVTYQWKEVNGKDFGMKGIQTGFIAQELEEVFPSMVITLDDSLQTKNIKSAELIPVLTKAIQEQQEIINELQKEKERQNKQIAENKKELDKLRELIYGLK